MARTVLLSLLKVSSTFFLSVLLTLLKVCSTFFLCSRRQSSQKKNKSKKLSECLVVDIRLVL